MLTLLDGIVIGVFAVAVLCIGLLNSRAKHATAEDYFLAGRGLTWPLIGFSLIAANISAEQMVGMSGAAANPEIGLAIASYEWMAAIVLVVVGFTFLPHFLRAGIYTVPEFLEQRFGVGARTTMSALMIVTLMLVNISTVIFLGAKFLDPFVDQDSSNIVALCWVIGVTAGAYVAAGGLRACAWADLLQGSALIVGGGIITWLAIDALGSPDPIRGMNTAAEVAAALGVDPSAGIGERLASVKEHHMHMFLPGTHAVLPFTALIIGLWIPHFYYWGLNQYIVQRTLGAKSLAEGQRGIVFAAALKLVIPFVVCVPGIIAFVLYSERMAGSADAGNNAPIVEAFEIDASDGSGPGDSLYRFRSDYAEREPEHAARIMRHNAAVLRLPAPRVAGTASRAVDASGAPRDASDVSDAIASGLAEGNNALLASAPPDVVVSPLLIGYDYDDAFPVLVSKLAPAGLKGFVIAALLGAVVSSLASMLNAASTIFTVDLYKRFLRPSAEQRHLVWVGRLFVPLGIVLGCSIAPAIDNPLFKGAFNFIQEFQGFISPGILTIFLFGLFVPSTPRVCGVIGLALSPLIYGALFLVAASVDFERGSLGNLVIDPFLNRMAITIAIIASVLALLTWRFPRDPHADAQPTEHVNLSSSPAARLIGLVVIACVVVLYVVFR